VPDKPTFLRQYQILGRPEVTSEQAAANAAAGKFPRRAKPAVPALLPVSKTTFWNWQQNGRAPKPVKVPGARTVLWRSEDIDALIAKLGSAK
jgi:predicted DNA-binding transcriptional regulator AlpA